MDKRIIEIEESLLHPDFLKKRENGLLLNNHQIDILERYQISWKTYTTMKSLLFAIEEILENEESEELEEKMCIRPTSETIFSKMYSKRLNSWRELPFLYNQWCSVYKLKRE